MVARVGVIDDFLPPRYSGCFTPFSPSYAPADTDMSPSLSHPPINTFNGSPSRIPYSPSFPWRLSRNTLSFIYLFIHYFIIIIMINQQHQTIPLLLHACMHASCMCIVIHHQTALLPCLMLPLSFLVLRIFFST